MDPMNHNNDQLGRRSERWVEWHSNVGGNQHLFKLDLRPSKWKGNHALC